MKSRHILVVAFILTALVLQACGATDTQAAVQTAIFQTQQISQLQTAAAGGTGGQPAAPTNTPQPGEPSSTPTITLTFTPSIPYVSVSQATNCRSGPSSSYTLITTIQAGEQAQVIKLFSNDYVLVQNPHGSGDCWLWLNYANTHDFSAYSLPFATMPPTSTPTFTPTPDFDWDGNWNVQVISGGTTWTGTMHADVSGSNISGSFHLEPGNLDYTFSGSLNGSRQKASGTWTLSGGGSGSFVWRIKSGNHFQFTGNL
ncbi:MAG TPA: SH3 domain-containing protein, partial [Terriglobales bacterium]|nr:SH3 domain-containing protein [Terriglobales bacterium]